MNTATPEVTRIPQLPEMSWNLS